MLNPSRMVLAIALLTAVPVLAEDAGEEEFLRAGKGASAHALDARLPKVNLGTWLGRLADPGTQVKWEANDCGEASGSPSDSARDLPVCAEAQLSLHDGRKVYVSLAVGTDHRGVVPPAAFLSADVGEGDGAKSFTTFSAFVDYLQSTK